MKPWILCLLMLASAGAWVGLRRSANFETPALPASADAATYQCTVKGGKKISSRRPIAGCLSPVRELDAAGSLVRMVPANGCRSCVDGQGQPTQCLAPAIMPEGPGDPSDSWVREQILLCLYPNEAAIDRDKAKAIERVQYGYRLSMEAHIRGTTEEERYDSLTIAAKLVAIATGKVPEPQMTLTQKEIDRISKEFDDSADIVAVRKLWRQE